MAINKIHIEDKPHVRGSIPQAVIKVSPLCHEYAYNWTAWEYVMRKANENVCWINVTIRYLQHM